MLRQLQLLLAIGLWSSSVDAQVFKPKPKKTDAAEKKAKPAAKKAPAAAKKKAPAKAKKATTERASEDTAKSEPAAKNGDKDFIRIWDDEDGES